MASPKELQRNLAQLDYATYGELQDKVWVHLLESGRRLGLLDQIARDDPDFVIDCATRLVAEGQKRRGPAGVSNLAYCYKLAAIRLRRDHWVDVHATALQAETAKLGAPKLQGSDLYFRSTKASSNLVEAVVKAQGGVATDQNVSYPLPWRSPSYPPNKHEPQ